MRMRPMPKPSSAPLGVSLLVTVLSVGFLVASASNAYAQDLSPPPSLGDAPSEGLDPPPGLDADDADAPSDAIDPPPGLDEEDDSGDTESYFISFWGQLHGGYLTGTSDRFEDGSQGFFGFAAGMSITVVDIFTDVRLNGFDLDSAGMWNQIGIGVSFGIPLPYVKIMFGTRVAYLYAQFSEGARERYQEEFASGERDDEASEKGLNFSAQVGVDVKLVGPLYINTMADVGYHVLLPSATESHGINFSILGGVKLLFGF